MKGPGTPVRERLTAIDWSEVRRRVEAAQASIEEGFAPSPAQTRHILKSRARALAQKPEKDHSAEFLDIVEFRLAYENYGIAAAFVGQVQPLKDFTPLPGAPPFVLGIVNMHGRIISVVDLKKFFNLPEKGLGELDKVIVVRNERMEFGILADVILGAHGIPFAAIRPVPATITGIGAEYLMGITEQRTIILDAEHILGDENIIVRQPALT